MLINDYLFEVSWEVCNKVGGIHTVISSKVKTIQKHVKNYFVIGPYIGENNSEFIPKKLPLQLEGVKVELEQIGIKIHYGKWNVDGAPDAILVEHLGYSSHVNEIKEKLWQDYSIDSLGSCWHDFDEVMLWSWCCGIVVEKISSTLEDNPDIFLHAHEWMSGGAIFYLNSLNNNKFKTVFTTHATMLGRTLCGTGHDVYEIQDKIDAEQKSYELKVHTKQQAEKALAHASGAFTTVSEITANETKNFYNKYPDRLLYNGFDNPDGTYEDKIERRFEESRKNMHEFLTDYFDDFYDVDLENSLVFYTSGRNEFRNKGVDIYIKSLGRLNRKLKEGGSAQTIINLFLIPVGNFKKDPRLGSPNSPKLYADMAPLSTHEVPIDNEIIQAFMHEGLLNKSEDRVKVILIPIYIQKGDDIFNNNYYDVIKGLDLGVFASYYEPWGYTPLESISFGVPTITSDLAGFGRAVEKEFGGNKAGVKVLKRLGLCDDIVSDELYEYILNFVEKNKQRYSIERKGAHIFSKNFSWEIFIKNYLKAYEIARVKNL